MCGSAWRLGTNKNSHDLSGLRELNGTRSTIKATRVLAETVLSKPRSVTAGAMTRAQGSAFDASYQVDV